MKAPKRCEDIQLYLAEHGLHVLSEDPALQSHLAECESCFAFLGALVDVDRGMEQLPEHRASEELADQTLQRVLSTPRSKTLEAARVGADQFAEAQLSDSIRTRALQFVSKTVELLARMLTSVSNLRHRPRLTAAFVTGFALILVVRSGLYSRSDALKASGGYSEANYEMVPAPAFREPGRHNLQAAPPMSPPPGDRSRGMSDAVQDAGGRSGGTKEGLDERLDSLSREIDMLAGAVKATQESIPLEASPAAEGPDELEIFGESEELNVTAPFAGYVDQDRAAASELEGAALAKAKKGIIGGSALAVPIQKSDSAVDYEQAETSNLAFGSLSDGKALKNLLSADLAEQRIDPRKSELKLQNEAQVTDKEVAVGKDRVDASRQLAEKQEIFQSKRNQRLESAASELLEDSIVSDFRSLKGLVFQEAAGYWANTYVPGDPSIRRMQTTLRKASASGQQGASARAAAFHTLAQYPVQPFDVPANSSLALQLASDRAGLDAPGRMTVQVGLRATDRTVGRRPALNTAIVLALSANPSASRQTQVRELLEAFDKAKDIGDRVRLFAVRGDQQLGPEDFRHGPITLALQQEFSESVSEIAPDHFASVYAEAAESVRADDNPNAPLGSSSVVVVTDFDQPEPSMLEHAHSASVGGIQTSVIALGEQSESALWEELVLSGQGSRYVYSDQTSAQAIVAKEIASVSRTVARAVRLRIRLAPGVRLVDVLGSYRLDEQKATQVREAEKSADQRIARNLGIQADRGEDEEGIQIVIPAFYAGDTHVVLLDVVAPGAGAIADVRVRYKDLVYLKNASATANLSLSRTVSVLGPLEQNVLKNLLAFRLSEFLIKGSEAVRSGSPAPGILAEYRSLLSDISTASPELARDREILADLALVDRYTQTAQLQQQFASETQMLVADSLLLAAKQKTIQLATSQPNANQ